MSTWIECSLLNKCCIFTPVVVIQSAHNEITKENLLPHFKKFFSNLLNRTQDIVCKSKTMKRANFVMPVMQCLLFFLNSQHKEMNEMT